MAELMANSAYTVDSNRRGAGHIAQQLCRTGIVPYIDIIFPESPKTTAMRPPEVFVVAGIVGTIAGNYEINQINISVAIAIVIFEIDITDNIGRVDSRFQYLANFIILFYITIILAEFHLIGTNNIELGLELATRIVRKIVAHTTRKRQIIKARIAFHIDHIVHYLWVVFTRETLVVKFNEDNQSPEVTIIGSTVPLRTTTCKNFLLALLYQLAFLYQTFGHIRSLILHDS